MKKILLLLLTTYFSIAVYAHESDSLFNLAAKWTDQDGKPFQLEKLKGTSSVIAMVYTHCQSACPLTIEEMKRIERDLKPKSPVRFVLVSFDAKRDSNAELKAFAASHHLRHDDWILLHGDENGIRELAAVLGIRYKADESGGFDHSNLLTLLDSDGVIRSQTQGFDEKAIATKLQEWGKN